MKLKVAVPMLLAALLAAPLAKAQDSPQTALAQCLVSHTSDSDRILLIKWIFTQFSLAPQVAPLANIPAQQRTHINEGMGQLITRLLAGDCAHEARLAYGAQGNAAIEGAFQVLGQTAARGLMQNPQVNEGMTGFTKYMDRKKLDAALGAKDSLH